jgi:UDP-N-acetylglucosamine acyltransferase
MEGARELQLFLHSAQDLKFGGEESLAIIGDNCTIRECVTINRGTIASGQTTLGNNCLIMATYSA